MTFLNASLLPLLALAAVPLLLHLLTLQRLRTVELPTFRFLLDSYVQQRRKMRFLEALLAMLRTLFLLGLVLAFARPVARHWGALFGGGSGREVVLLVDGSASMGAKAQGASSLDRAKGAAFAVVERLNPDDRVTLIRVGSKPEEVLSRFSADPKRVGAAIDGLKTTPTRANQFAALMHVFGPESARRAKPTVYVFTDGQAVGWREVKDQGLSGAVPEGARLVVVDVGPGAPVANRAVLGDPPGRARAVVGLPFTLRPRAVAYGSGEPAEATLSVFLDEKEIARTPVMLRPGEPVVAPVSHVPAEPGLHRGRFEIAAAEPDGFPDDDAYLFTLAVEPPVSVLLVNGNPNADPFQDDALYLRTALTASAEGDRDHANLDAAGLRRDFLRSLDVREIPEGQLNADALRNASLVVLANCGNLNADQFARLRDFVAGGGGLLVFPGDRVNPDLYNQHFFPVPGPQGERMTAASLGPADGDPDKPETFERLAAIDFGHPVLAVFDDPDGRFLHSAHVGRRFPLNLPEKPADAWTLATFTSGKPALVESRFGDGRLLLAAFPAHVKWTNLPLKPEFVPLILRLAAHARARPELDVPPAVPPGGSAAVAVAGTWSAVSGKVIDPDGREQTLDFERSNARLIAPYDGANDRGYYAVEVKGGPVEQPKAASAAFAVNLAPEESRFEPFGADKLRDALPGVDLTFVDASAGAQQLHGSIGREREVWRPLILALFAIIGVEFTLATLSGRRSPDNDRTLARRLRDASPGRWVGRMTGAGSETD